MRHTSAVSTVAGVFAGLALALGFIHTPSADDADRSDAVRQAVVGGTARNILLFIGDGMGNSEITLARNYAIGAAGRLALDTLPMTGAYTTYSVEERDPSLSNYVPDSAATGTAWATGHKTSNGRIATSPSDDRDLPTILEIARQRGYRTGDVTTAVSYGTNGYHRSQDHTGTQVRIAALGPQAANVVGVRDQTDLFRLMLRALEAARPPSTR